MSTLSSAAGHKSARVSRLPADDTLPRWRAWVLAHPVGSSLLAGGVATQFATVFGIWFKGFGLPTLNWPTVNGALIIPTASPGAQYFAGWISHFADGVFFALLFALLFHPLVPLRNTILGNIIKGVLYGSVLAIISAAWCRTWPSRTWALASSAPASGGSSFSASSCGTGSTATSSVRSTARCQGKRPCQRRSSPARRQGWRQPPFTSAPLSEPDRGLCIRLAQRVLEQLQLRPQRVPDRAGAHEARAPWRLARGRRRGTADPASNTAAGSDRRRVTGCEGEVHVHHVTDVCGITGRGRPERPDQ